MLGDSVDLWRWSEELGFTPFIVVSGHINDDETVTLRVMMQREVSQLIAHNPHVIDYLCQVIQNLKYTTKPMDDWPCGMQIKRYGESVDT